MKCLKWTFLFLILQVHPAFAFPENGTIPDLGEKSVSDTIVNPGMPEDLVGPKGSDTSSQAYTQLDSFNEMAIQKKFLPKRHRFEFGLAYGRLIDNAFVDVQIYYGRIGYSVFESWALELNGYSADKKANHTTRGLGGAAAAVVSAPSGYTGLDLKWSPIYGKVAFWNASIIPVEQFFVVGGGSTDRWNGKTESTFHAGTGFSFGIYRWAALRTELGIYHSEMHLSLGVSTFYPGADTR